MRRLTFFILAIFLLSSFPVEAKKEKSTPKEDLLSSKTFSGLKFRSIGPAYAAGRIADFAVNPNNYSEYYVGVACGNVWKTTNSGITFTPVFDNYGSYSIASVVIDPNNTNVVRVGTEFGLFFTIDGGKKWVQLKGGLPTISVKDIVIQKRENDLVLATFGRGFYILDDYSPLRRLKQETLKKEAVLFPVKDALMFIQKRSKTNQGQSYYAAKNPPLGATFTYYLKESIKTKREKRQKAEKEAMKKGETIRYPSFEELHTEDEEETPYLIFTVYNEEGNVIRRLRAKAKTGMNRITWDFRYPDTSPTRLTNDPFDNGGNGILALPGNYKVAMGKCVDGVYTELAGPQNFKAVVLENTTLPATDRKALVEFRKKVAELSRAVQGTVRAANDLAKRIDYIKEALHNTPAASAELMNQARAIEDQTNKILRALTGDRSISRRYTNQPPSISGRINGIIRSHWRSISAPTQTVREQYKIASGEFEPQLVKLKILIEVDLKNLEKAMEKAGAPWTLGRIPEWKKK